MDIQDLVERSLHELGDHIASLSSTASLIAALDVTTMLIYKCCDSAVLMCY